MLKTDFILNKGSCQRVLRRKVTRSDLHFNRITVAAECVCVCEVVWRGGRGDGEGRRQVARVETGRPCRRLLLYPDEGFCKVQH